MKYFMVLRYAIYALLAVNTWLYLQEDLLSSSYTHADGLKLADIATVFSGSIDTIAWLILLLMLELETAVLPRIKQRPWVDWLTDGISLLCGLAVLSAWYGYIGSLGVPFGFEPVSIADACSLTDTGASIAYALDVYVTINAENCTDLVGPLQYNAELNMYATQDVEQMITMMSWVDVVNSTVWILVCVVLELEVYLHSSKYFGTKFFFTYKAAKFGLYGILFVNAILWWIFSTPLDGWDAMLWLFAFFFIEMNLIKWQGEAAAQQKKSRFVKTTQSSGV